MDSTNDIDPSEALRAVRAATALDKQRKQMFRELERRIARCRDGVSANTMRPA